MMPEYPEPELMTGGIGKSQPADPEVQALCDSVKSEVEAQRGEKYETFRAISYKKQTVYGYNYFVKVHIGQNKHLELVVFVGLPHTNSGPVLQSVHESKDNLEQEGGFIEPFICYFPPRQEIMMPEYPEPELMTGGIGKSQPADPEVQALCDSVKSEVEAQRGEKYETFRAISYKQQTVYGYNYFVKVHVGGNKHLELFLYVEPDPNSRPDLRGVKDFTDDQISDLQQEIRDIERFPPQELIVGGIGESQPADPEVQAICDSVKRDVEEKRGEKYETFEAISYRTQVVAGTNYTVKVHIGENKHLELVVFVGLPHTNSGPVLQSVHESTDDQISDLGQEPVRLILPEPVMCYREESRFLSVGESQPADPEVQALCDSVKSEVEAKRREKYEIFEVISYKKQAVYGFNYYVTVHVDGNKHLELWLHVEPSPNSRPVLRGVQTPLEPVRPQEFIVGGIGESQPANPEVQAICNSVKRDVEEKRGEKYETFEAISYRTQSCSWNQLHCQGPRWGEQTSGAGCVCGAASHQQWASPPKCSGVHRRPDL
ncbi:uncharacterized protein LOC129410051 isoform X2 [Boleophthalmus pectinirostris]|uniref:uncharacterized protein LOC129410051 isoform X2 n=1 Tax=Boleophthalmus pectinirostris TaxID=150288 RepID=UPI00243262D2|nr:uncharacterized protein LOC129410051 isoform X2 [Boleophthalmus pectinirostris]